MERRVPRAASSLLLLAVVTAVAVAAGCGGSSTSGSSSAGSTTKASTASTTSTGTSSTAGAGATARFISEADTICSRTNAEIDATKPKSASKLEIERVVPLTAVLEAKAVSELEVLKPPPALASDWAQVLDARRGLARELITLLKATQANDKARMEQLAHSKAQIHASLHAAAEHAGFKHCGEVGVPAPKSGAAGAAGAAKA